VPPPRRPRPALTDSSRGATASLFSRRSRRQPGTGSGGAHPGSPGIHADARCGTSREKGQVGRYICLGKQPGRIAMQKKRSHLQAAAKLTGRWRARAPSAAGRPHSITDSTGSQHGCPTAVRALQKRGFFLASLPARAAKRREPHMIASSSLAAAIGPQTPSRHTGGGRGGGWRGTKMFKSKAGGRNVGGAAGPGILVKMRVYCRKKSFTGSASAQQVPCAICRPPRGLEAPVPRTQNATPSRRP